MKRVFAVIATLLGIVPAAGAQTLPPAVDSGLALAARLARESGDRVWPGWSAAPTQLLLLGDSLQSFVPSFSAPVQWSRARTFPPSMQATFPLVGGVPTIVIGTPAASHQPVERWALTVLHEHLHQLQYTRPDYYSRLAGLKLDRGDSTGMWALNFPFPYDSAPVAAALKRWANALATALSHGDAGVPRPDLDRVRAARASLDSLLAPDDRKYLDFQLWQEGVPRWTELALARLGHGQGIISDAELRWQEDRAIRELRELDPARDHRVIVYSLGAAVAALLDEVGGPWRETYFVRMFQLDSP